jgi:molybdenum cofactor biosynthesis enzyme MoaA
MMSRKRDLPEILERVQRCRHCGREMNVDSISFLENPFCSSCLIVRMGLDRTVVGELRWRAVGDYMELIPTAPQRPS